MSGLSQNGTAVLKGLIALGLASNKSFQPQLYTSGNTLTSGDLDTCEYSVVLRQLVVTLRTRDDPVVLAPGTLGTREDSVISASNTSKTGDSELEKHSDSGVNG